MMVDELTAISSGALPIAELRAHLRMGTGFGEDTLQDTLLEGLVRAAIATIEGRTGKALIRRQFIWTLTAWRNHERQVLPLAPVVSIDVLRFLNRAGSESVIDAATYRLGRDPHRPVIAPAGARLPAIPTGGMAEIEFTAGYGAAWGDLPADLGHAVLLLAAHYYENRHAASSERSAAIPFGVAALLARYRVMRIGRGSTL